MDKDTLKITARALREKLEILKDQNPDAMTMLNLLRDLLLKSENGDIHTPLGMLRSTCRAAAASCNFPGTYSVIGRKVTEKSCTESFFDRFS
ncbi:hypothetical protein ACMV6F_26370, partial [Pseudomonas putida]